jgi:hypothetical protein
MNVCTTSGEPLSNKNSNNSKLKKLSCACSCAFLMHKRNEKSSLKFLNENELWVVFASFFRKFSQKIFFSSSQRQRKIEERIIISMHICSRAKKILSILANE